MELARQRSMTKYSAVWLRARHSDLAVHTTTVLQMLPRHQQTDVNQIVIGEALANAIVHGAHGLESDCREQSPDTFLEQLSQADSESYSFIRVSVVHQPQHTLVLIADPGNGFDWENRLDSDRSTPSGLRLIAEQGIDTKWNDAGNKIQLALWNDVGAVPPARLDGATGQAGAQLN